MFTPFVFRQAPAPRSVLKPQLSRPTEHRWELGVWWRAKTIVLHRKIVSFLPQKEAKLRIPAFWPHKCSKFRQAIAYSWLRRLLNFDGSFACSDLRRGFAFLCAHAAYMVS